MERIIVKFKNADQLTNHGLKSLSESVRAGLPGSEIVRISHKSGRVIFNAESDSELNKNIKKINNRKDVEYAERDVVDSSS